MKPKFFSSKNDALYICTYVMLVYNLEMIEAKYTFDWLYDEHALFVFVLEHKYNEKLLDTYTTI